MTFSKTVTIITIALAGLIAQQIAAHPILGTPHFLKAKKAAAEKDVNLLVHFTASWSNPCSKMFGTTYREQEVRKLLKEEMVFALVDIDDFDGYVLASHYNIENLPTLVLFSPDGRILRFQRGFLDKEELLAFLDSDQKFEEGEVLAEKRAEDPGMMERINGGPSGGEDSASSTDGSEQLTVEKPAESPAEKPQANSAPLREFYSIQIGAFSERANAEKLIEQADQGIRSELLVYPESLPTGDRYLLLGGQFDNRQQALDFLSRLKERGMDGFVKKIDNSANS
ncbi:MAG: hypothetical protein EA411_05740 [Saprospirales bacterium]|nr:MAG: hypothetical protein EA411_05740 [Saprospirales bacterium]